MDYEQYKATYGQSLNHILIPILKMSQRGIKRADKPVFAVLDQIIEKAAGSKMESELNELFKNIRDVYDCDAANLETLCAVLRMDFKHIK